jgi:FtsZ-interacting cell division protein ZipA
MKKLVLTLAIIGFIAFGALSIQNIVASSSQVEMVKFDKDPKKANDKKTADSKDSKTDTKAANTTDEKTATPSSTEKSASPKSCCSGEKEGCAHSCPDKK